jgi:bifunctional non-homologous end joining protein LigD
MPTANRPQLATNQDARITSVDWVVEPCWKGDRLLARFHDGRVDLADEEGTPVTARLDKAAAALARAIDANQAVIDGIWTDMPFTSSGPARAAQADDRRAAVDPDAADGAEEPPRAFVAWDLVELDGQPLHDVPLLERRRLLESVLAEDRWVRISPAVRQPIDGWLNAWRANGFTHYVAKQVNSRYVPGEVSAEWLQVSLTPDKQPSFIDLLLGRRPRKVPHISD